MTQPKKQGPKDDSHRKQIRFGELLEKIDKARGKEPLGSWVKKACQEKLDREN